MTPITDIQKSFIGLSFFTFNKMSQTQIGKQLMEAIFEKAPTIAPNKINVRKGWKEFTPSNYLAVLCEWENNNNLLLKRDTKYVAEIPIMLGDLLNNPKPFNYWVEESYFFDHRNVEEFLDLCIAIYQIIHPCYGYIHDLKDSLEMSTVNNPILGQTIPAINLEKGLPGVYWANFFGPRMVNRIGRDTLMNFEGSKPISLPDGGILILTSSSPIYPSQKQNREKQNDLRSLLGEWIIK